MTHPPTNAVTIDLYEIRGLACGLDMCSGNGTDEQVSLAGLSLVKASRTMLAMANEIERLLAANQAMASEPSPRLCADVHLSAMCAWGETLAGKAGWTRENAASFWSSYDAARAVASYLTKPAEPA